MSKSISVDPHLQERKDLALWATGTRIDGRECRLFEILSKNEDEADRHFEQYNWKITSKLHIADRIRYVVVRIDDTSGD